MVIDNMKRKIKIVHFLYNMSNGGVETVLLNYFSNINLENITLYAIIQDQPDLNCVNKFKKLNFEIIQLKNKKNHPILYTIEVLKILNKIKPDIVHSHMNLSNFFPLLLAKCSHIKVRISHSHSYKSSKTLLVCFLSFLNKIIATQYMACGKDAAIYQFGKKLYNKNNIYILSNAINVEQYEFNSNIRKSIRDEFNLSEYIVIGHIGRFTEQKNHIFLLKTFKNILQFNKKFKLLLIGTGPLKSEIIKYVYENKINDNVIFLECRDDIPKLLMAMDLFFLPSLYEGLPLVAIEAQASNLFCVFSDKITRECQILPKTKFVTIDNDTLPWEKVALNFNIDSDSKRNENIKKIFEKSGFDIESEAARLEQYYFKILER